jgi:molybdopterin molybdotransferase
MPEFLTLLPPDEARELLLAHLSALTVDSEPIETLCAVGRVVASDVFAPQPLPDFPRSTVDGYALRARDTFGASDSLPAYLALIGEAPMGASPSFEIGAGQCALIHTGGMTPNGADAVVMIEYTQAVNAEIEIFKSVAAGENVIRVGEDMAPGQLALPKGTFIRPAEIGGLMAFGMTSVHVAKKPKIGIISTGDEVIDPSQTPRMGQVRDVNSYTLSALIEKTGGEAFRYGIFRDDFTALKEAAAQALSECAAVIVTAGSSASTRDMTADVIRTLGAPGVLVHGINTRPGKPTILGVCDGKAVIGLPGNPVSALVNGYLFVAPVIEKLLGAPPKPKATVQAKLTVNLPSQAGREDWQPVKLIVNRKSSTANYDAEPIFGKSNLIFTLAAADGLLRIHPDATGLSAGEMVEVWLM